MSRTARPLSQRLAEKLRLARRGPDDCWIWPGAPSKRGYGYLKVRGKKLLAHCLVYRALVGNIPSGTELDHLCRNRICVNPRHLEPVTHRTNMIRGDTVIRRSVLAVACPQGHPYDSINTRRTRRGKRECRACDREYARNRRATS